ncbi:fungal-specific transcription factor domain-containing protein [Aspergillus novoparasiticus]|uniref:Fungal-specific transcription factor domain-containing protein n=1 Tax=Aspergillus novoparasiticus TaxID=986946 RepID=A0A5N6ENP7_9EURO|nr:fungal-specific transcription factor domain-containing protein [Aspergillus novoparasiticus]
MDQGGGEKPSPANSNTSPGRDYEDGQEQYGGHHGNRNKENEDDNGDSQEGSTVWNPCLTEARRNVAQVDADMDNNHLFFTSSKGEMRFYGPSSGFSIFAPGNLHRNHDRNSYAVWKSISHREFNPWQLTGWIPQALKDDFSKRQSAALPSKLVIAELVAEYFSYFNVALPLFNKQRFLQRLETQYSWNPDSSPAWWAALNIVLALAERRKAELDPAHNGESRQISLGYVKNALNVVVDLFLNTSDLLSVQATLGLALYFQDTANPQPLFMFSAAALRMAQAIGMHRSAHFGLSESELEERRNVFWIAFSVDADICMRTGRPPMQDAGDYDISLPRECPSDGMGVLLFQGGTVPVSFLHLLSRFALLQRRVYSLIYSVSSLKKRSREILQDVKDCEDSLRAWQMSIPPAYRPGREFKAPREAMLPYILRLHFAFHCCQTDLHRVMALSRKFDVDSENDGSDLNLSKGYKESISIAVDAARSSIALIDVAQSFGSSFCWNFVYFPAAAAAILFAHLLAEPTNLQSRLDLERIRQATRLISNLVSEEPCTYLDYILEMCKRFQQTAETLLRLDKDRYSGEGSPIQEPGEQQQQQQQQNSAALRFYGQPARTRADAGQYLPLRSSGAVTEPSSEPGDTNTSAMTYWNYFGDLDPVLHGHFGPSVPDQPDGEVGYQAPFPWSLQDIQLLFSR